MQVLASPAHGADGFVEGKVRRGKRWLMSRIQAPIRQILWQWASRPAQSIEPFRSRALDRAMALATTRINDLGAQTTFRAAISSYLSPGPRLAAIRRALSERGGEAAWQAIRDAFADQRLTRSIRQLVSETLEGTAPYMDGIGSLPEPLREGYSTRHLDSARRRLEAARGRLAAAGAERDPLHRERDLAEAAERMAKPTRWLPGPLREEVQHEVLDVVGLFMLTSDIDGVMALLAPALSESGYCPGICKNMLYALRHAREPRPECLFYSVWQHPGPTTSF
jgi:hypothetical protein